MASHLVSTSARKGRNGKLFASAAWVALIAASGSALAGTYHATDDASLRTAITNANADADASSSIILDNDIAMTGVALPNITKPTTIDTNGHIYSRAWFDNSAGVSGAVNMNGGGAGSTFIFKGNYQGGTIGAGASGAGDPGLFANAGKVIQIDGAFTGGAGGGLGGAGGAGVGLIGASTLTNAGTITGGSAVNGSGGAGMNASTGPTIVNTGTIRGGDGLTGGIGFTTSNAQLVTLTNSGTIQGGKGSTGAGGDGLRSSPGNRSITNNGAIQGGDGVTGGWGVNFTGLGTSGVLINNGTIKGGNAGTPAGNGVSGAGVIVHGGLGTFVNTGTITGGIGGAAVTNSGGSVSLVNSGTLNAGDGYDTAILMQGTQTLTLELRKGSTINGKVTGNSGVSNSFILGGDDAASFDVSTVGPQYQNFTSFQKTGNSVWTLTGTGSIATPWTIAAGTLQIGNGSSMIGDVTDNATLAFNRSDTFTFANLITGTGGVTQTGTGRTILTAVNTYTGPTTVAAGTLSVNGSITSAVTVQSGGTLGGTGTVGATTAQSGGTIAPGNSIGTLHINGAFTQSAGSIYQVEVDPTSNASDLILVNGTATLQSGAGLNVTKNPPGEYQLGTVYTVLTASGGLTGTYAVTGQTSGVSAFLGLRDSYDAKNAYLTVVQTRDPATVATTPNQTNVAENQPPAVQTPILNAPSDAAARSDFDALSGEALASARGALVSGSLLVRDTSFDRLRDLFCAVSGDEQQRRPGCVTAQDRPILWVRGFGNWGHTSGNANAAGLSQSTGGFLVGVDVPVYDWRAGIFGGYSRTDFDVTGRASSGASNNYHIGGYGGTQWNVLGGDVGLKLGASYSWNAVATDRSVVIGSFSNNLAARYNAGTTQVFGELGQKIALDSIILEPFANLAYVNLRTQGFSETGGEAALTSRAGTMEDTFTTLGVRPSTAIAWGGVNANLRGMLGWRHTFGSVTPSADVSFAGGNSFSVEGAPIARDAGVVEAGADFDIAHNVAFGLTYGGQFSSAETAHGVRGTVTVTF